MEKKRKKRNKKHSKQQMTYKKMITILIIIIALVGIYQIVYGDDAETETQAVSSIYKIADIMETSQYANVTRYIVYGTHFNIEGNIEFTEESTIEDATVVAMEVSGDEVTIETEYTYEDNFLEFSTLEEINTGLDLESLEKDDYYLFLKVVFSEGETKYYSLSNDTEYGDITYYTLTRNNSNNQIYINFSTYKDIPILGFNITEVSELPEDVYDVVIDPGHGGSDVGAVSGNYEESEVVLECAEILKEKLEDLGLKVLLTRDGTESDEDYTAYNMYDEDGRVTITNESGAKILISLHLNSNSEYVEDGGVEVYASPNSDLTFAKLLADNIVSTANTSYSQMETYQVEEGVYVRTINISEYSASKPESFQDYNGIFDTVPYLFMVREIGGIATGAYVDETFENYDENIYRNSNVGVEGYLIELGYMNVREDLQNVLRNQDDYMEGIANSINTFYGIT